MSTLLQFLDRNPEKISTEKAKNGRFRLFCEDQIFCNMFFSWVHALPFRLNA